MGGNGSGLRQKSIVVIHGVTADGAKIEQNMELEHDAGTPEAALIGQGINFTRQLGGMVIDAPGGAKRLYPLMQLKELTFSVSRLVVVSGALQ